MADCKVERKRLLNIKPETPQGNFKEMFRPRPASASIYKKSIKLNTAGQFTTTTRISVEFQNTCCVSKLQATTIKGFQKRYDTSS